MKRAQRENNPSSASKKDEIAVAQATFPTEPPKPKLEQQGWGPGLGQNFDAGDKFTFTFGAESFSPVAYNSFTVGPFSATVTVRKGEGVEDVYLRAYQILQQIFEVEFKLKRKQYFQHLGESGERE